MSRLTIIIAVILGLMVIAAFGAVVITGFQYLSDSKSDQNDAMVLYLNFSNGIPEMHPTDPFSLLTMEKQLTLLEFTQALETASMDPAIKGVVADLSFVSLGITQIDEIRDALDRFHARGKWSIAYADTYFNGATGTGTYYLASAFQEIYMHRTGDVGFLGLASQPYFLAGIFEKYGVKPVMGRRHEYKTMVNRYTETGYTDSHREIETALLQQIMDQILTAVSSSRNIPVDTLMELVNKAPFLGQEAIDAGLIDGFKYWDDIETLLDEKANTVTSLIRPVDYYQPETSFFKSSSDNVVAVVYGLGEVVRGDLSTGITGGNVMASKTVARAFRQLREDGDADVVIFRVNSPGGSHDASDTIAHEVKLTEEAGIPVIVSMGDVAASGGYYVSMYADTLMARANTITGSIGVAGGKFVVRDLLNRLGITIDHIAMGDHSMLMSILHDPSESEKERMSAMLDRIYADFTHEVMVSRELTEDEVDAVARGRVWTGTDALERGLVDRLGGLYDALELAREKAEFSTGATEEIRVYPREQTFWEMIKQADTSYFTRARTAFGTLVELTELLDQIGLRQLKSSLKQNTGSLHSSSSEELNRVFQEITP